MGTWMKLHPKFTFPWNFVYFTKIKTQANETQIYIISKMKQKLEGTIEYYNYKIVASPIM